MAAKGIKAGEAYVRLGTDDSAFHKGLKRAEKSLKELGSQITLAGKAMAAAGAAILAPITAATVGFARMGSELADAAARTGASVEALSALSYAAQQTGTDLATVETGIKKTQVAITDAAAGSKTAAKALAAVGLSAEQLVGLKPEKQFEAIAAGLAAITDPSERAAAAVDLLGKGGAALLPLALNMRELTAEAARLGVVMSTADSQAADSLGDSFDMVKATVGGLATAIGTSLAPVLIDIARQVATVVTSAAAWVKENGRIVQVAAAVGVGLVAVRTALAGAGAAMALVIPAASMLGAVIAAIVSPIGLAVGALGVIAAAIAYVGLSGDTLGEKMQSLGALISDVWAAVVSAVEPVLSWLREAAITVFAGIAYAIGNWRTILDTAMVGAMYGVVKFGNVVVHWFGTVIPDFLNFVWRNWYDIWTDIFNFTGTVLTNMGANIYNFFTEVVDWLSGGGFDFQWIGLTEGFQSALRELPQIAAREIGALEGALGSELDRLSREVGGGFGALRDKFAGDIESALGGPVGGAPAPAQRIVGPRPGDIDPVASVAAAASAASRAPASVGSFSAAAIGRMVGRGDSLAETNQLLREVRTILDRQEQKALNPPIMY